MISLLKVFCFVLLNIFFISGSFGEDDAQHHRHHHHSIERRQAENENRSNFSNKGKVVVTKKDNAIKKETTPKPPEATYSSSNTADHYLQNNISSYSGLSTEIPVHPTHSTDENAFFIEENEQHWPNESDLHNYTKISNYTEEKVDDHRYYKSTQYLDPEIGRKYWIDLTQMSNVVSHEMLSHSHRRAATVKLSFDFPFYGHVIHNITIATGGFLYTGTYVHSWLAATQYIAPLMANFDTSLSNESMIRYADNGTTFVVEWRNVVLQDNVSAGNFSFQVALHKTGDIVFAYKEIPVSIIGIRDELHPVKVGLSDAYIIERTIFFMRRKTIYEYHRVDMKKKEEIGNESAIVFTALPTCVSHPDCESCLSSHINFECAWCPVANRCSDGMDRKRQDWLLKGCERMVLADSSECRASYHNGTYAPASIPPAEVTNDNSRHLPVVQPSISKHENKEDQLSSGSVLGIIFLVIGILLFLGWIGYAYRFPHTSSGQLLIRYRPSQWRWGRGEAAYTAASIHM